MTKEEREEARARCEAASGQEWSAREDRRKWGSIGVVEEAVSGADLGQFTTVADAAFAAHARTDLPKALDALDALEPLRAAAEALCRATQDSHANPESAVLASALGDAEGKVLERALMLFLLGQWPPSNP